MCNFISSIQTKKDQPGLLFPYITVNPPKNDKEASSKRGKECEYFSEEFSNTVETGNANERVTM